MLLTSVCRPSYVHLLPNRLPQSVPRQQFSKVVHPVCPPAYAFMMQLCSKQTTLVVNQQRHSLVSNGPCRSLPVLAAVRDPTVATWTRPTPDRDENWTKPSYVPTPGQSPVITPYRGDDQPLYTPSAPEFKPAEMPEQQKEMPKGPSMPERRPDPIPAGNPKEKPPAGEPQTEAPPATPKEK